MASPPRNACLGRGVSTLGVNNALFQVPSGFVALVKTIGLIRSGGTSVHCTVYLQGQNPFGQQYLVDVDLAETPWHNWEGWVALNQSDVVFLYNDSQDVVYWVSGALLPYAPGLSGATVTLPFVGVPTDSTTLPPTPVSLPPPLIQA